MKDLHIEATKEITKMFHERKFMNVAKLVTTYNQKQIKKLIDTSLYIISLINMGAEAGLLDEHFESEDKAFVFKSFIESQNMFFIRALLHNEGALIFSFKTIENKITESVIYLN